MVRAGMVLERRIDRSGQTGTRGVEPHGRLTLIFYSPAPFTNRIYLYLHPSPGTFFNPPHPLTVSV